MDWDFQTLEQKPNPSWMSAKILELTSSSPMLPGVGKSGQPERGTGRVCREDFPLQPPYLLLLTPTQPSHLLSSTSQSMKYLKKENICQTRSEIPEVEFWNVSCVDRVLFNPL